ncbi:MAG: hypothetical protein HKN21_05725, partial [Candidatus Eisenbacteria bacterium]|nr:hypothetical protein [Candidatus Eisenbacteria bacterium]
MRRVFSRFASLLLILLSLSLSSAFALPLDESDRLPVFTEGNVGTDVGSSWVVGLLGSANLDTTYFGGTVWAPDSMRWEAIQDSCWTFDTGVGSHFNHNDPHVNPFKDPSLHAYMEGWIGIDNTLWNGSNFYGSGSEVNPYFRRMVEADFPVDVCVGTSGGLGGTASFWAGLLDNEAMPLCFADGQGYGNGWNLAIEKSFTYNGGAVTLSYSYVSNTEPNFDYSYCEIDTSGMGDVVTVHTYTGMSSGVVGEPLVQGVNLPFNTGNTIRLIFRVSSDGAYSDEDGLYATLCGALAVDDISLTGAINDNSNFESGDDGWTLAPPTPGPGGDWSDIVALSDLPLPLALCECDLEDSVLVFNDNSGGKTLFANNTASSPWIDLKAAGLAGAPGKFVETNIYANLPLLNYIFAQFNAQWYPTVCPDNGLLTYSGFESNGFVFYFGGVPQCTSANNPGFRVDFSDVIDPGAEQVRLSIGIVSYCRFFANCSGITNTTPWFDFVKLGVHGSPDAPILVSQEIHWPFDSFPQNGTLQLDAAGRIDGNDVKGASSPQPGTSLGDTLVVTGGGRGTGNNTNTEVYVQFMVDFGPGAPQPAANDWLASHDFEGMWNGQPWFSARIDT